MAKSIPELTAAGALAGTEPVWIDQSGPKRTTVQDIADLGGGGGLTDGTVTNSVLRWDGANWVEETQVTISSSGILTLDNATGYWQKDSGGTPRKLVNIDGSNN